jgi:hypothetical protein
VYVSEDHTQQQIIAGYYARSLYTGGGGCGVAYIRPLTQYTHAYSRDRRRCMVSEGEVRTLVLSALLEPRREPCRVRVRRTTRPKNSTLSYNFFLPTNFLIFEILLPFDSYETKGTNTFTSYQTLTSVRMKSQIHSSSKQDSSIDIIKLRRSYLVLHYHVLLYIC